MPGPVSNSYAGPSDDSPYVPYWCFPKGPRMCPCRHHEGFHAGVGKPCVRGRACGCTGLPIECFTPDEEMFPDG